MFLLKHKLAIENDEKWHKDRNKSKEIVNQKAIGKDLDCKFILINPDEKFFHEYLEIGKVDNHVNRSSKKSLIDKI